MKKFLLTSACLLIFTSAMLGRMNVIFFLVDDLGYHDLSLTGSTVYETPRIDQLAGDGAFLTQAHAAFPRCVPSRYAMMTGVHPSRAESVGERPGDMDPNRVTIAEALKAHGYKTFFAGKWHIGKKPDVNFPDAQGFDINVGGGTAGAPGSYWYPYPPEKKLTGPENLEGKEGDYLTDALTDKTVEFIEGHAKEPFFVYLSHYAVHTPIQGKPEKTKRYQEKIGGLGFEGDSFFIKEWTGRERRYQDNAEYAAMIESVDESLGRITDSLKANGIYDETIIILTSDHGGLSNSGVNNKRPLATSNYPLRAGKGHMYDGGLRVPVIVHWPGKVIPGTRVDFSITGMDYYPTILEMLGFPQQPEDHIDGISFAKGLLGEDSFNAERAFFWYSDIGRLQSTGDRNAAVIRKGDYKLMEFFQDEKIELYNVSKDPGELNNLVSELPEVCKNLLDELRDWKKEMKVKDRNQTWGKK